MLRMSQRTWNNVLIFIVLAMILVLNLDKFSSDDGPTARLVVPEGEFILNITINQVEIEKAGQQWRISSKGVQPSALPSPEQLQRIVSAWQQTYISPAELDFDVSVFSDPDSLVVITLAGKIDPVVVALKIVEQQLFLILNKQVYILNSPSIKQLLEPIVNVQV
jgi:hypothetical protein